VKHITEAASANLASIPKIDFLISDPGSHAGPIALSRRLVLRLVRAEDFRNFKLKPKELL
jgi:hypothetical protein